MKWLILITGVLIILVSSCPLLEFFIKRFDHEVGTHKFSVFLIDKNWKNSFAEYYRVITRLDHRVSSKATWVMTVEEWDNMFGEASRRPPIIIRRTKPSPTNTN